MFDNVGVHLSKFGTVLSRFYNSIPATSTKEAVPSYVWKQF